MDKKTVLVGLVVGILIGAGAVYGATNPRLNSLQTLTDNLTAQVESLQTEADKVPTLQQQITALTGEKTIIQGQATRFQTQVQQLQTQVQQLQAQVQQLQTQITQLASSSNFTKYANIPANQLIAGTLAYGGYPIPDYAWIRLKDLGITLIQVEGGPEGNVLHIQANENHPYGCPYDPDWAENLDSFLSKADSYGIKVVFHEMGNQWGTSLGILAPMECEERVTRYTSVSESLRIIDKLGGDNALHKNFIADPRIAWWSPINEARVDGPEYSDVRDWTVQLLQRIKNYGGKTSVCVNNFVYGDVRVHDYSQTFPQVISTIGQYVDYLQAHVYCPDLWEAASNNPNYDMYTNAFNEFSTVFQSMINGRGSYSIDKLMLSEFGCGYGNWWDFRGPITTTAHQQAMYIEACFDAAKECGIEIICYHEPFISSTYRSFGFIEPDGTINQESYIAFKGS